MLVSIVLYSILLAILTLHQSCNSIHINTPFMMKLLFCPQAQDKRGTGAGVGGSDGYRVLLCGRDGLRVADSTEDRRRPSAYDHGLGAVSTGRLLPQSRARSRQRPLQTALRPPPTIHRTSGNRRPARSV